MQGVVMVSKKFCPMLVGLTFFLLAACQPQEEAVVLPTLAVLPTLTPSDTPTLTPIPTQTFTPTATSTATSTPTATFTLTSTPSLTFTPSLTSTSTITPIPPTATATATNTATNTPVASNTPVATSTPIAPQILSFNATATNVTANSSITLVWSAQADSARLDVMNAQGQVSQTLNVVPSGSLPVSVPGNLGSLVVYRLVVFRGAAQDTRSVAVTVQCSIPWFFGNQFAPPEVGCPTGAQSSTPGAFQAFERGVMLYI